MADDRPYRVYRGGGRIEPREDEPRLNLPGAPPVEEPKAPEPERRNPVILPAPGAAPPPPAAPPRPPVSAPPPAPLPAPKRRRRVPIGRVIGISLLLIVLVAVGWAVLGYLAFRSSVQEANARLDAIKPPVRPALAAQSGLLLRQPTNILVLGVDKTSHSDTIQILRTDPDRHLVSTLALPRDLRVQIPGQERPAKLNAAFTIGGPALAVRTVSAFTGLPIHHVILVEFEGVVDLVDALGGIDIVAPKALQSTFEGKTVRFPKGAQHLDGQRALAYARVRKNALDPNDSDVTRGQRQQQVIAAIRAELVSPSTLLELRGAADAVADPLATDLEANQILQLGWVSWRAQTELRCNLGGDPRSIDGEDFLLSDGAANRRVIGEFLGRTAIQPAPKGDPFAAVCRKG